MAAPHQPIGSAPHHSLAFRVMRLCRPSLQSEDALLRIDPLDLLAPEDLFENSQIPSAPFLLLSDPDAADDVTNNAADFSFRDRFHLRDPLDAMALSGLLVLPQSFGSIYLGETFCSYISINNSSNFEARDIAIKAEIQSEKERKLLLDTTKSPVESIRAGGRYDFIVEHDVRELGPHTLVCSASYKDGDSERKYLPQFFKFVVSNPLSVRTKVRTVKDNTYLEACIENHTKSNLYMDQVEFEPSHQWVATRLEADEHDSESNSKTRGLFKQPVLVRAGGGIYNYLYHLKPTFEELEQAKVDGSSILGKFQITWRTNLGEPGKLQTQQIHGTPTVQKDTDLRVKDVPAVIILDRPFLVHLCLTNHTDRSLGPFEVFVSPDFSGEDKVIMINGIQKLVLPQLGALSSTNFDLNMIATRLGVQKIAGITVLDAREKKTYDPLPDVEIFVDTA